MHQAHGDKRTRITRRRWTTEKERAALQQMKAETRTSQVLASLKDWCNSEQLKMHPVALTLAAAAAEIESLVKNLQTCERKAEEILEHTTGGERTRKAALEIRIAAVAQMSSVLQNFLTVMNVTRRRR